MGDMRIFTIQYGLPPSRCKINLLHNRMYKIFCIYSYMFLKLIYDIFIHQNVALTYMYWTLFRSKNGLHISIKKFILQLQLLTCVYLSISCKVTLDRRGGWGWGLSSLCVWQCITCRDPHRVGLGNLWHVGHGYPHPRLSK